MNIINLTKTNINSIAQFNSPVDQFEILLFNRFTIGHIDLLINLFIFCGLTSTYILNTKKNKETKFLLFLNKWYKNIDGSIKSTTWLITDVIRNKKRKQSLPIALIKSYVVYYPTPVSLTYTWSFGSVAGISLVIQIISGMFLAIHYAPNIDYAFDSVEYILRDVNYDGWFVRYLHSNGVSIFFVIVYFYIRRCLYYGSYIKPRQWVWMSGVSLFLLLMSAFTCYYMLPCWYNLTHSLIEYKVCLCETGVENKLDAFTIRRSGLSYASALRFLEADPVNSARYFTELPDGEYIRRVMLVKFYKNQRFFHPIFTSEDAIKIINISDNPLLKYYLETLILNKNVSFFVASDFFEAVEQQKNLKFGEYRLLVKSFFVAFAQL